MKETVITVRRKRREIIALIGCFIVANLVNLYAIIRYKTSYTELFTMLGYVVILTFALYFLWTVIRLIFYAFKHPKRL